MLNRVCRSLPSLPRGGGRRLFGESIGKGREGRVQLEGWKVEVRVESTGLHRLRWRKWKTGEGRVCNKGSSFHLPQVKRNLLMEVK